MKNKGNTLLFVLVIFATVLIASVGVVLLYKQETEKSESSRNSPNIVENEEKRAEEKKIGNEVVWKTYVSLNGYSFVYPSNWILVEANGKNIFVDKFFANNKKQSYDVGDSKIVVEIGKEEKTFSLSGVEESYSLSDQKFISKSETEIGTKKAKKYVFSNSDGVETKYYIEKEYGKIFYIFVNGVADADNQTGLDAMFATFNFVRDD